MRFTKCSIGVALAIASLQASATLYGTIGNGGTISTLVELDASTGAVVKTIGSVGYAVNGLTYDAATRTLYATTSTNDSNFANGLIKINTTTGAGAPVGSGAHQLVNVATANSTGGLYGWTERSDDPVLWNKTTGTITVLGDAHISSYSQSLAFDNSNKLYILNGDHKLYQINLSTGLATLVGTVSGVTGNHHGDFNPANNYLYALKNTETGTQTIYVIDINTLTVVSQISTVNGLFTLAFGASNANVLQSVITVGNNPARGSAAIIDGNSNLQALFNSLSSDRQVSNAATQTLPLLTGAGAQAALNTLTSINNVIQSRIQAGRGQASGDSFTGDKNVWMKPFGSVADQDAHNGVSGYKANTYGMIFGADAGISSNLRLGAAFAYAKSDINGASDVAPQSAKVDVYQLIGYGSYSLDDRTAINFQADAGQNMNRGRRQLDFISKTATSHYQSDSAHLGVSLDRGYRVSEKTVLTPSIRADYTWIRDHSYSEAGAGLLNLNVDARTTEALVVGIDGRVAHQVTENMTLLGNIGVGYDALGKQASTTAAFAGASNSAFVTYGIDPNPWSIRAGAGVSYKVKENLEITGRYDAEHRESFLNQTASVKARWAF